jgi:hypothetical protein
VRRVGVLAELHDAKADGVALGRAPMGGEEGRAASSPRGGDVDVAVKSAVVMFTATALIPCLAPSGSRRHGTPGARSPVFETVVVLDGSGAGSCSVSSFVPVLGAALVVSGDGTLGMARLTVGGIGVGVRAEPRKDATGCGAPEHAATEQRGGAGDWESAERCGESEGKEKGKIPIGLGTRSGWGVGPRLGARSKVGEVKSWPELRLGAKVIMATWPCANGERRPMGVTVQG